MEKINLKYPEICFLDGNSHKGNKLEGRNVVLHVPTMTIIEFLHTQEFEELHLKDDLIKVRFVHKSVVIEEEIVGCMFKTQCRNTEKLQRVIQRVVDWYLQYLDWEDANILEHGI